jgi:DNA-binding response OmpR family regulator
MKSILVIEEELELRESLQTSLVQEGYHVRLAVKSEDGLALIINHKPDLIILDMFTHSLHGTIFMKRLRQLPEGNNDSRVVVLTDGPGIENEAEMRDLGVEEFIIKNEVTLTDLVNRIKSIL